MYVIMFTDYDHTTWFIRFFFWKLNVSVSLNMLKILGLDVLVFSSYYNMILALESSNLVDAK